MIRVVSTPSTVERGRSLIRELNQKGIPAEGGAAQKGDLVIALLSASDAHLVPQEVVDALDLGLHIIIARTEQFDLPRLINHLSVIDLDSADALDRLSELIAILASPDAPLAIKVLTPKTRRSNRSTGIYVTSISLIVFILGLIGVGYFGLQAPLEEYDAVDTEAAMTRDFFVGPELQYFSTWLPRSTEDAANYQATLSQLPTAYRPLMGLTVTAYAQGTPMPTIAPTLSEP